MSVLTRLSCRRLSLSLYNIQTVTVTAALLVTIIVLISLLTESNNGTTSVTTGCILSCTSAGDGQAGGQSQDIPGQADVVAALFLESDDPYQNDKIQFDNNFHIPDTEFPAEKQKILLLAYSSSCTLLPDNSIITSLVNILQGWLQLFRAAVVSQPHSILLL